MKKKYLILMLTIIFVLFLSSCNKKQKTDISSFLIKESVSLTSTMGSFAGNEEYRSLFTSSSTLLNLMEQMSKENYKEPKSAYLFKQPDASSYLNNLLKLEDEEIPNIPKSEDILNLMTQRMTASYFSNFINMQYGSDLITATSLTTWQKSYIMPDGWEGNMLVLLQYDGDYSSLASFMESGDGVITATCSFIKFPTDANVQETLTSILGASQIEFTSLSEEELQNILKEN